MDQADDPLVRKHEVSLYIVLWVPFTFAVIILGLRFWSRIVRHSLGTDDWTMLAGWTIYTAYNVLSTFTVARGCLRHILTIPRNDLELILKINHIIDLFNMWALTLCKISVGLLILRLMHKTPSNWRKYFIYGNITIFALILIPASFFCFYSCDPPRANWDLSLQEQNPDMCRFTPVKAKFGMFQSYFSVWMDFALPSIAATFIFKLQLTLRKKLSLCLLLSLGIIASAFAIVKALQFSDSFTATDLTFNGYKLWLWASIELPLIIIAGSIPPAKPAIDRLIFRKPVDPREPSKVMYQSQNAAKLRYGDWPFTFFSGKNNDSRDLSNEEHELSQELRRDRGSSDTGCLQASSSHQIIVSKSYSVQHAKKQIL